ncbi:hypothetical protein SAMN05421640_1865 [Ekhidna lutea]|uniref:Uncharacterized protein n=1 Tax=Ekhidna lutea TaxID=447679 RepID=A0A239IW61_EKHLU|nr:hypothetical protein [Ekhidna lutea]SNS97861.1 hypothetical protein SAMN05421640_1865 [Ekhidna lutea]
MKRINKLKFTIGAVLLWVSSVTYAQQLNFGQAPTQSKFPDTLTIVTDTNKKLIFAFNQMSREEKYLSNELWNSILSVMETSLGRSLYDEGVEVTYIKNEDAIEARITITPFESKSDVFVIGKEGISEQLSDRIVFTIKLDKVAISFFVDDVSELDHLKSQNIESLWSEIKSSKKEFKYRRSQYQAEGIAKYGDFKINKISSDNPVDFVELGIGVGLGYYADRFAPDISYDISFRFHNRFGKPSTKFGLLYTQHYFVSRNEESEFDIDLNGFLSGYFAINTSSEKEYGIGFGYLINQNGSFYKGDTFKMTVYNRKSSKTSLSPEIIFTDGFKKAFPALRFGLTF